MSDGGAQPEVPRTAPTRGSTESVVRRNAIANFAGSGWSALMTIVFIPIYIRAVGIEGYAIIALQPVLHAWLSFLDAALAPALSRELARYRAGATGPSSTLALLKSVEWLWAIFAGLVVVILVASDRTIATLWLNANALPATSVARGIDLIALLVMLRLLESAYHGALIGLEQLVWYNGWLATMTTLRHGGAALVVIFVSPTIEAFFAWHLGTALVGLAILALRVHRSIGDRSTRAQARASIERLVEMGRFAAGTSMVTVLAIVLSQVDKLLLSRLVSLESFGYYMLASSVAAALYIAVIPVAQAVYPRMVDLVTRARERELSALYHRATAVVTVVSGTAAAVLFLMPVATIFAWSGDMRLAERVAPVLAPAALGTFLHGLINIPYQLQLSNGWTGLSVRAHVAAAIVYLPALFIVVPQWGGVGAAWLWVALNALLVITITPLMHQRILPGEFRRWLGFDVLLPITITAMIVGTLGAVAGIASFAGHGSKLDQSRPMLAVELTAIAIVAMAVAMAAAIGATTCAAAALQRGSAESRREP